MKKNETLCQTVQGESSLKTIREKVVLSIAEGTEFVVSTHIGLDGDALGSLIAMGLLLEKLKKNFYIALGEKIRIPPQYNFLPRQELIQSHNSRLPQAPKVFIALECPSLSRLGNLKKIASRCGTLINIDHHGDNKIFGNINLIDKEASSTCEILFFLSRDLGVRLNLEIATCLYTGIVTDTGRFQHANTTKTTFEVARKLLELGIKPNEIFQKIYENRPLAGTKLLGIILSKAEFLPEIGLIYSVITKEDFLLTGIDLGVTEDYVDFLRAVRNVRVAALIKEISKEQIKVSLRSKDSTDVSKVAAKFGGGGHRAAAGYTSKTSVQETINNLVKTLRKS